MPISAKPMRFAHSEGHTDVCFDDLGRHFLTCGSDGDVRVWQSLEDDDPVSHRVGESAMAVAFKDNRFFVALDTNSIQAYSFPDGVPDGVVTRFTAPVSHMEFNTNGNMLIAGASDFSIKVVKLDDNSFKVLQGHEAPILSVALDPKEDYVASSSCDGTIKIWKLLERICIKTLPILPKCNDISLSKSLARLCWNPDSGKVFVVPVDKEIRIYERGSWNQIGTLKTDDALQPFSVCLFSFCGQYLASACTDGLIFIWDFPTKKVLDSFKHTKGYTVCGLAWNPCKKNEIAYTDIQGQLGLLEWTVPNKVSTNLVTLSNFNDIFEDSDDEDLIVNRKNSTPVTHPDELDQDELPVVLPPRKSKLSDVLETKSKQGFRILDDDEDADDDQSKGLDIDIADYKAKQERADNAIEPIKTLVQKCTEYHGPKPTLLQEPFQSGSTPIHLTHRFMVWNSVGIIRSYNTEEENSIDVEFHDTSVHHTMHFDNPLDHTMADLSTEAVLLACEAEDDSLSKLVCMPFGLWDNSKDWSVDLPSEEAVKAICLGAGWVCAVTNKRNVRLFSIGGLQRELFTLPGPVVCTAAQKHYLLIVYHLGTGVPGDQHLGYSLFSISKKDCQQKMSSNLPISMKSILTWIGFTLEGTPVAADSEGIVRILNSKGGNLWIQLANLKELTKGKSDHYWVVGVSEANQQIRCIPCKGSRYPHTLPRPAVSVLSFQMPLCDLTNDKGQLEENFWKSKIMFGVLNSHNNQINTTDQEQVWKLQSEALMKLFALACKTDREYRAVEIAELMPTQHALQLTIKYATFTKRMQLAQRLSDMARQRLKEETEEPEEEEDEEEEEEDFRTALDARTNHIETQWSRKPQPQRLPVKHAKRPDSDEDEDDIEEDENEMEENEEDGNEDDSELLEEMSSKTVQNGKPKAFSSHHTRPASPTEISVRNPFKVGSGTSENFGKATLLFDKFKKQVPKTPIQLLAAPSGKKKVQRKLSNVVKDGQVSNKPSPIVNKKSGFDLWLESNRDKIKEDNLENSDEDVTKLAVKQFRLLTPEEKKEWNEKAAPSVPVEKENEEKKVSNEKKTPISAEIEAPKKRKRPEKKEKQPPTVKNPQNAATKKRKLPPSNLCSKLSSFAFTKIQR